jgi:O-antigen/teichoic acid export membrane protein
MPQTLLLAAASGLLEALFALWLTLFRIRERAFAFAALSCGRMLLFLGSAILLVQMGMGLSGALAGRLLAASIALIVATAIGRQYVHWTFDMGYLRRVARYGLPLLPTNLAIYVLLASDRYILQSFSTLEVVGIYTFAYKIATTLDVLITRPFAIDWAPRRFKIATAPDAPRKYALVLLGYLFVGTLAALLIVAVTPAIYQWIAPVVYHQGMTVVPIILAAYLIYGLSYPLNVGIMLKDKTVYLALIGIASAGICLALNFWLIPIYGMMGAAYATVIGYTLWTGGITWVSLRLYPVPYSFRLLLLIGLNTVICYAGIHVLSQGGIGDGKSIMHSAIKLIWVLITFSGLGYVLTRKTGISIFAHSKQARQVETL